MKGTKHNLQAGSNVQVADAADVGLAKLPLSQPFAVPFHLMA